MDKRVAATLITLVTVTLVGAALANPPAVPPVLAQEEFTITDLGTLGWTYGWSWGTGINDLGQVVGWSGSPSELEAFLWDEESGMTGLGTLGGASYATAINDLGQVVGHSYLATEEMRAFLWEEGRMTDLGTLGGAHSWAWGINNLGQVVGQSTIISGESRAFLWEEGGMTELGTLGGSYGAAMGINELGQVVGWSELDTGQTHAFLWDREEGMTDLGTLGGPSSSALGINDLGQVVGWSELATGQVHATLWQAGRIMDLGTLGGSSVAYSINFLGQIVGHSDLRTGQTHAFLWEDGRRMTDLGTLGGAYSFAMSISDLGQAAGSSELATGQAHATLWTVPPPMGRPAQAIARAVQEVATLVIGGTLNEGQGNALMSKLEAALRQLDRGNASAATNILEACIRQVEAMVHSRRLTTEEAQPIVSWASAAIQYIESPARSGFASGCEGRFLSAVPTGMSSCSSQYTETHRVYLPVIVMPLSGEGFKVGMVSDVAGVDDASFNENTWAGLLRAQAELGVQVRFIESDAQADYAENIQKFAEHGYDLIFTVGFLLSDATVHVAPLYPETKFVGVDQWYDPPIPNAAVITFAVDEAAFPCGYLAAGWAVSQDPEDPQVGYVAAMEIPPVLQFTVAYEAGVAHYNERKDADVRVSGVYVGDFEAEEEGRLQGNSLIDQGVDVIFGVGGKTGNGGLAAAKERGKWGIGAEVDQYYALPSMKDILITSCMKRVDNAAFNVVQRTVEGSFPGGGIHVGALGDGGVGLAPLHEFQDEIPAELKQEVRAVIAAIIDGEIDTGWPPAMAGE